MATNGPNTAVCAVCGIAKSRNNMVSAVAVRPQMAELIKADVPAWDDTAMICGLDLNRYRKLYVDALLRQERGELSDLERSVIDSIAKQETLTADPDEDFVAKATVGERLADHVATFGGSWRFIVTFCLLMAGWITYNQFMAGAEPFDPFPFILLNLCLSCLAALQAPIIMMSQNRQEAKDRMRAQNDFRVNLKAELEIRQLHEKLDHLLSRQWERMAEIQRVQLELMEQRRR